VKINDAVFGALLLVLGLAVLVHVQSFPRIPGQNVGPALFPGIVAAGLVGCALLLILSGLRSRPQAPWVEALPWMRSPRHIGAFLAVIGATIAYVLLANRVGFLIVAPLALLAMFVAFGVRAVVAVVVAVAGTLVIWYAFYKLLRVPLPWGVLERFAF
jgi:putative tricarboxylic transport membrane protein